MITPRRSADRGRTKIDWLDSRHTFSFGDYYDPGQMGFRTLRVINEDRVRPGAGFPTHAHRDMEIITYILEGALEHKDSLGTGSIIRPGEAQRMSAGAGITHSEFNHSKTDPVHFLQIWITPSTRAIAPGYEQRTIDEAKARAGFATVGSPDGHDRSVKIHQDAVLSVAKLERGQTVEANLKKGRHGWVQVARGTVTVNGIALAEGDGAAVSDEAKVTIAANSPAEVLLFDLA
ncbi:MAG: pirin family protein [Candidatus Binatus sp.]|uniref:pirin family protein n=1 Tax=Candidatus Binatus sp. TaxID=2811406 RepID=UPI003C73BE4E